LAAALVLFYPIGALFFPTPAIAGESIHLSAEGTGSDQIEAALAKARASRASTDQGATIELSPGVYRLSRTLTLTALDSGTKAAPLTIRGASGGPVIFTGAVPLTEIPLPAELAELLPLTARSRVKAFRLPPAIIAAFMAERVRSSGPQPQSAAIVVNQGNSPLHFAQWPNEGYARAPVIAPQPGPKVDATVTVEHTQAVRWAREPALRAGGYWTFDWAYEARNVKNVDTTTNRVELGVLQSSYRETKVQRYKIINAFCEIDSPGEFAVDPKSGTLVAWPVSAAPVEIATLDTVVSVNGAQSVVLDGIGIIGGHGDALAVHDASGVLVENGYLGMVGRNGATVTGSTDVKFARMTITDTGETGLSVASGDVGSLTPGNGEITDSIFTHTALLTPTYRPAVKVDGVGETISGSLFSRLPHAAIIFDGNDHRIIGNEFTRTELESGDAGVVYTYHDLTARGTLIEGNYFHDIRRPPDLAETSWVADVRGVYLDGWASGTTIRGNLFVDVTAPVWINSGSDNVVAGNVFIRPTPSAIRIFDNSRDWISPVGQSARQTLSKRTPALNRRYGAPLANDPFDGRPRRNLIGNNLVAGGVAVDAPIHGTSDEQISTQTVVNIGSDPMPLRVTLARFGSFFNPLIRERLQDADREAALASIRYANFAR